MYCNRQENTNYAQLKLKGQTNKQTKIVVLFISLIIMNAQ